MALWRSFRDSAVSTFGRGDDVEIEEYLPKTERIGLFLGSPTTAAAVLAWLIYAMFILVLTLKKPSLCQVMCVFLFEVKLAFHTPCSYRYLFSP